MMCQRHAHATVDGTARAVPSASVHGSSEVRPVTTGSIPVCQSTAPRIAAPATTPRSLHGGPLIRGPRQAAACCIAPPPRGRRPPGPRSPASPRRLVPALAGGSRSPSRRAGSHSQRANAAASAADVAGRHQQPGHPPVRSLAQRLGDPAARAVPAPAAPAPRPRSRPSRRSRRGWRARAGRHRRTTPRARGRCGVRPARTGRRGRPILMSRNRSSTNSGAFVRARRTRTASPGRRSRSGPPGAGRAPSRVSPLPRTAGCRPLSLPTAGSAASTPGWATWTRAGSRSYAASSHRRVHSLVVTTAAAAAQDGTLPLEGAVVGSPGSRSACASAPPAAAAGRRAPSPPGTATPPGRRPAPRSRRASPRAPPRAPAGPPPLPRASHRPRLARTPTSRRPPGRHRAAGRRCCRHSAARDPRSRPGPPCAPRAAGVTWPARSSPTPHGTRAVSRRCR